MGAIPRQPWMLALLSISVVGCAALPWSRTQVAATALPNPLEVPVADHEFVWNQLVDTIDNYFPIAREDRVRVVGNVMTQGRIETQPINGATYWEFFRKDSTPGFERWQSTFQSIRRQAEVQVYPGQAGYGVQVIVRKELEDVDRPELSTVGGSVQRHDGSLVRPRGGRIGGSTSLGWIPIGRDLALEQRILAEIYARLCQVEVPPPVMPVRDPMGITR